MNEAIKLAIVGGWKNLGKEHTSFQRMWIEGWLKSGRQYEMLLDPKFWKALSKALEFEKGRVVTYMSAARRVSRVSAAGVIQYDVPRHRVKRRTRSKKLAWKREGRRCWDWIMDGKSADDFFKALLAERRAE